MDVSYHVAVEGFCSLEVSLRHPSPFFARIALNPLKNLLIITLVTWCQMLHLRVKVGLDTVPLHGCMQKTLCQSDPMTDKNNLRFRRPCRHRPIELEIRRQTVFSAPLQVSRLRFYRRHQTNQGRQQHEHKVE